MNFALFLFNKIKISLEYSGLISKFIIGFGICLILCYFIYIDYFPTDLSLGDGLLFFLITIKFLLVYLLFLSSHYALGRIVIFVLSGVIKIFIFLLKIKVFFNNIKNIKNITWAKVKKIIDKISIKFIKFIFYIFGFVLIFLFYNEKSLNLLLMIFLSILLAYCIDIFIKAFRDNNSEDKESTLENTENKNLKLSAMLIYILFFPSSIYLFYSEKPNNFLINSTLASIREDDRKSIIFIKFGLKDLFPESKIGERKGEYIELKNTEILLRGIGKNALVQYKSKAKDYRGNDVQIKVKVEIPNDSLLVVRRSYSR